MRIEAHLHEHKTMGRRLAVVFDDIDEGSFAAKQVSNSRRFSNREPLPATSTADRSEVFAAHYPLTVAKCREMRAVWGDALKVHRTVSDWFRQALAEHDAQDAKTKQTDAELVVVPRLYPRLNQYLKGDQRVTAAWIANAYRNGGLLADEVGTGKTVGVVAGLIERETKGDILIVCPKISVKAVWWKELTKHTDIPVYACKGDRKNREKVLTSFLEDLSEQRILVVVSEMLRVKAIRHAGRVEEFLGYEYPTLFEEVDWDAIIVDESHKLLGSMDVVRSNLAGEGLRALGTTPDRLKLAVSATPWGKGGRVEALFGTLHWLWPDEFTSRWAWLGQYFDITEDRVFVRNGGGASKMVRRVGGLKSGMTEERFWQDLGPRVLRRTMEEVSPEHRGLKNFISVACEMDARQARQYKKFSEDGELAVEGGIITSVGVLDYMIRARQFANGVLRKEGGRVVYTGESAKIDMLIEHLDRLDPSRRVVISSQYNEFLDAVEKRLYKEGHRWYRLDGKTTETERERIMNAFQGDGDQRRTAFTGRMPGIKAMLRRCPGCGVVRNQWHEKDCDQVQATSHRVFLLNSQAGGVSITLDAAEEMHQLDRMYPPEANTQLYGRIFRRGRAHEVFYYLYESMGTIDEAITAKTEAGHAEQLKVLDGRRGLEYVRTLAQYNPEGK